MQFIQTSWKPFSNTVYFTIADDLTFEVDVDKIPEDLQRELLLYGVAQMVGAAGRRRPGDPYFAKDAMQQVANNLYEGRMKNTKMPRGKRTIIAAISDFFKISETEAISVYISDSIALKKTWQKHPEFLKILAQKEADHEEYLAEKRARAVYLQNRK